MVTARPCKNRECNGLSNFELSTPSRSPEVARSMVEVPRRIQLAEGSCDSPELNENQAAIDWFGMRRQGTEVRQHLAREQKRSRLLGIGNRAANLGDQRARERGVGKMSECVCYA